MTTNKLPDKPSELIRVALKDLELCEADPTMGIDMTDWHVPREGICAVCFAGGVMSKTLGVDKKRILTPHIFDEDTRAKLNALDAFRSGQLGEAFSHLQGKADPDMGQISEWEDVESYPEDPVQFKADMHAIANHLEENGF